MCNKKPLHVPLPAHLLDALDGIKRDRSHSDVVIEAVEHYVELYRYRETLRSGAGSLDSAEREIWSTDQRVDDWVRARRAEYESREHPEVVIEALDHDLLAPAVDLLARYLWPKDAPANGDQQCREILLRLLEWPSAAFFLARRTTEYCGFASINWGFSTTKGRPILRLQDLFVLPEHRRRGVARALVQHLERVGRAQGANRIQLETGTENSRARAFYEAWGFEWFPDKEIYMRFL